MAHKPSDFTRYKLEPRSQKEAWYGLGYLRFQIAFNLSVMISIVNVQHTSIYYSAIMQQCYQRLDERSIEYQAHPIGRRFRVCPRSTGLQHLKGRWRWCGHGLQTKANTDDKSAFQLTVKMQNCCHTFFSENTFLGKRHGIVKRITMAVLFKP